ncbi:Fc.00g100900.m01.CDS01 [Cosmosporella sp. VM-42]
MSPPPSTPTPRRFLLAKRGTQSSQTPSAPPRFQSTPRFGSSSVPRPTQWRKERDVEDVEEVEDRVEESELEEESDVDDVTEDEGGLRKEVPLNDSIEIESDGMSSEVRSLDVVDEGLEVEVIGDPSRVSAELSSTWDASSPIEERESKRRKLSISPERDSGSPDGEDHDLSLELGPVSPVRDATPTSDSIASIHEDEARHDESKAPQQPTFRPPPRFKPVETDPTTEGLPAAFSPQRRGAKYLPNGLAAELQGWLSEVKGWEGIDRAPESLMTITVQQVRPGKRMYLVEGRLDNGEVKRIMLAGEGKLTGLGRRAVLGAGSRVVIGQPVWDVVLEGEAWTVSCDWSVA